MLRFRYWKPGHNVRLKKVFRAQRVSRELLSQMWPPDAGLDGPRMAIGDIMSHPWVRFVFSPISWRLDWSES